MRFRSLFSLLILVLLAGNLSLIPARASVSPHQDTSAPTQTDQTERTERTDPQIAEPRASIEASPSISLKRIGRYKGEGAEIVTYDPQSQRLFITNGTGAIDIVDIADPTTPNLVNSVSITTEIPIYGTPPYEEATANSVAVKNGLVAVAIADDAIGATDPIAFFDTDGNPLGSVGAADYADSLPDMVTFTPDGSKVLVANEGEPANDYLVEEDGTINDPEGSISIIDVSNTDSISNSGVTTIHFTDFNEGGSRADELPEGVRIFGPQATVAQDLEPEYIAVAPDGTKAWVVLQENNAVAVVDIASASIDAIVALGTKDHTQEDNALDASDKDDSINIQTWPVKGFYMPDAIAAFEVDGATYLATANEGDARDYDGFSEELRVEDLTLDPDAFPNAAELQAEDQLGRLKTTSANGDTDGDGDVDQIYSYGARSMSIWNASGELVFDTGDHIAQTVAARFPDYFNGQYDDEEHVFTFDDRSDDKGTEPEGVTTGVVDGQTYAFVGLERMGGIMVYDVTDPTAPTFVQYVNTSNFMGSLEDDSAGDVSPEGMTFIAAEDSPTGKPLLVVTYEVSLSTAIFEIGKAASTLTVLHNNDGESSLLPLEYGVADPANPQGDNLLLPVGGVAAFKSVMEREIADARAKNNAVVSVFAGDAFLASATLQCTLQNEDGPFYDAVAQNQMPYDIHTIGNHEFDFSPDFLERFIRSFTDNGNPTQPFLGANLDFSNEPGFADLLDEDGLIVDPVNDGRVVGKSAIVTDETTGDTFGIVGMSPYYLRTISSPRDVEVTATDLEMVADVMQQEIDRLMGEGIDKIILVSHLQSIQEDRQLIPMLRHVDIAVSGGGDELLVNPAVDAAAQLLPGEQAPTDGNYPVIENDADGRGVPIVTTAGNYKYLGRLDVIFDESGEVANVITDKSYIRRVIPESDIAETLTLPDTVTPDADIVASVDEPVEACLAEFDEPLVRTEVVLDVSRTGSRSYETNAGNMVADSYAYAYQQLAEVNSLPPVSSDNPVIAVQNGGGIRQNAGDVLPVGGIAPGPITLLNTLDVLAFFNYLTAVQEVTPDDLKSIFERSASRPGGGQFLQVSGVRVVYDTTQPAQEIAEDGTVTAEGSRVVSLVLSDGTPIIQDGAVVDGAPNVTIVTNSFTADGGDNYPWLGNNTNKTQLFDEDGLPLTYQQTWVDYMLTFPEQEGLPTIPASDPRYQSGGDGRISFGGQYVKPVLPGMQLEALLTVGETTARTGSFEYDYRMVGIPDGLGAYRAEDGNVRLFMNHEFNNDVVSAPIVQETGALSYTGAIISEFVLSGGTPAALSGDLAFNEVYAWNGTEFVDTTAAWLSGENTFARFSSGYMAGPHSGNATLPEYIYLAGEDATAASGTFDEAGGQAVAVVDNKLYALADMGRFAKENVVVAPTPDADPNLTVVFLLEHGPDSLDSQLYIYIGTKQPGSENPMERAGLVGGDLYFFRSTNASKFDEMTFHKGDGVLAGEWVSVTDVITDGRELWNLPDEDLNTIVQSANPFNVIRVEDVAYDRNEPGVIYFTTTGSDFQVSGNVVNNLGRVNKLTFDPINPTGGAAPTLEVLLEGDAGDPIVNPDNIDVNAHGQMMIQEDPNSNHRGDFLAGRGDASIWLYDLNDNTLARVAEVDQTVVPEEMRGESGAWETSGIIDVSHLYGSGTWLLDVQAHSIDSLQASQLAGSEEDLQVVEGGQLLLMKTSNSNIASIGSGGGTVSDPSGAISVEFPSGLLQDGSRVAVTSRLDRPVDFSLTVPPTTTVTHFQIEVTGPDGMPVNELDGFATIRVNLAQFAELIETKKINASNIAPVFWDGDSWSDPTAYPPCRLNPEVPGCDWSITDDTLTITLDHLSDFAVTGPASQGIDGIFLPLILNAFQSGTPGEEPTEPITPTTPVTLTLLHNNDGETGLLPTTSSVGDDEVQVGGIAAFKTVTEREIAEAQGSGNAVVNVYAGDSFLASATLQCSFPIDSDKTIFDAVGQQQIPYTAHILGNHEFDYTPDFLERFINAFAEGGQVTQPFLSANLDFSGEPAFDSLVDADGLIEGMPADGRPIGKSMIVTDETTGEQFGIVGATTSNLANISSPRNVTASDEAPAVQAEIDRLLERGVNKIIFVSHLQDVDNDIDLISQVEGIDVAVAGGGDDFLVSSAVDQDAQLLPGMSADEIEGDYPRVAQDAAGRDVYIVTSIDKYRFLGRLDVAFDAQGEVTSVLEETSYPRRVVVQDAVTDGLGVTDAVVPDAGLVSSVNDEVEACLQELADTTIATTEVLLDVSRDGVRGGENAMGNLVADSFMFVYDRYAEATGLPAHAVDNPVVALQNGGGIRQNAGDVLPRDGQVPGPITQLDTIDVLPFDNFISVVPEVTPADLLEILDNRGTSGINHVANLKLVYNTTTNDEGETIYAIDSITLINADGSEQPLVEGGAVVDGAPNITVVTNSFVAANEFEAYPDQVFLVDADGFKLLYEQPLREYLLDLGTIATDDQRYQEGGEGRIIIQPATSR